jgi:hypothetical protein
VGGGAGCLGAVAELNVVVSEKELAQQHHLTVTRQAECDRYTAKHLSQHRLYNLHIICNALLALVGVVPYKLQQPDLSEPKVEPRFRQFGGYYKIAR